MSPIAEKAQLAASMSNGGYFGLLVDNPDAALNDHSKKNWSPSGSSIRSAAARSPLPVHVDNPSTPFQKQAEALAQKLHRPVALRKLAEPVVRSQPNLAQTVSASVINGDGDYFTSAPVNHSPSIEFTEGEIFPQMPSGPIRRASTVRSPIVGTPKTTPAAQLPKEGRPSLISPSELHQFLSEGNKSMLLLDVRTYKSFSESRITTAVNLCIPTTLLKRPSFNVAKLSETFASDKDKERFSKWKTMDRIVVYDNDSKDLNDSSGLAALHTLNKFSREGWKGRAYVLQGEWSPIPILIEDYTNLLKADSERSLKNTKIRLTPRLSRGQQQPERACR